MNKTRQEQIEECKTMTAAWIIVVVAFIVALCVGCKSVEYVPVVQEHTEHHWHTDTVRQTDSIIDRQTTTIREVDSATMAEYGVQIKSMQRAWIIETDRLQRELSALRESVHDTVTIHDSVPAPYPVTEYIEKQLTWWQRTKMYAGVVFMLILGAAALYGIYRLLKRLGIIHI